MSSTMVPVEIKLDVLSSVAVLKTPVALLRAAMSSSLSVMSPDTVLISVVNVCPVVIRLVVKLEMSVSLFVICVCNVCPVVIRLPLISSTILPVDTKFVETVFIFVVNVCPVVIKFPLKSSTLPLNAVTSVWASAIPETIVISEVKV